MSDIICQNTTRIKNGDAFYISVGFLLQNSQSVFNLFRQVKGHFMENWLNCFILKSRHSNRKIWFDMILALEKLISIASWFWIDLKKKNHPNIQCLIYLLLKMKAEPNSYLLRIWPLDRYGNTLSKIGTTGCVTTKRHAIIICSHFGKRSSSHISCDYFIYHLFNAQCFRKKNVANFDKNIF